jgi:hypothetical protein
MFANLQLYLTVISLLTCAAPQPSLHCSIYQTARYHSVQQSGSRQNSEFHFYHGCTNLAKNLRETS